MSDSPRPLTEEERQAIRDGALSQLNRAMLLRLLDLLEQSEEAWLRRWRIMRDERDAARERLEQSERLAKNASEMLQSTIARLEQSEARAARLATAMSDAAIMVERFRNMNPSIAAGLRAAARVEMEDV